MSLGTMSGAARAKEYPASPATSWTAAFWAKAVQSMPSLKYLSDRGSVRVIRARPGAQAEQPQLRLGYGDFLLHA